MPTISAREQASVLADLLLRERFALAEFLVALAEFDRGRAWEALGYASLFDYLHRDLGLSKGAAFYRMTAARLIQAHPMVVEPLRDGRLFLTSIFELAKVLTAENRDEVLPRFFQLSKREAAAVAAELRPPTVVPSRVVVTRVAAAPAPEAPGLATALPASCATTTGAPVHLANQADLGQPVHLANQLRHEAGAPAATAAPRPAGPRVEQEPLTAERSRLHLTVSRRLLAKLEEARAALSHSRPDATADEIIEAGLDLLLERAAKRRGLVKTPRKDAPPSTTAAEPAPAARGSSYPARRYIPAQVRRAVWTRDGGRCQAPLASGGICGSTWRVELDHIVPFAHGGPSTVENLRCLCGRHNARAAREAYGDAWMDRYSRRVGQVGAP